MLPPVEPCSPEGSRLLDGQRRRELARPQLRGPGARDCRTPSDGRDGLIGRWACHASDGSYAHSWNKRLTPAQRPSSSRGQQLRRYPPIDQNAACERFTGKLHAAATATGGIVSLIQNIAGQINLPALNATIESAAGETGRGFAVVASEVKNLASQAARATEQISGEINAVQMLSNGVAESLTTIRSAIETLRSYIVSTAAAVEEQSVLTREMSSNMQGASQAVSRISGNVNAISTAVARVSSAVTTTKQAAKILAR
jgi:archaellum component FlaC